MARPQQITCPNCGQPFNAIIEQILDVGIDPTVKNRLLSGRINVISCPHCGYQGMIGTPIVYHDPEKQLAIIYVPMELNLPQQERERLIGDMTRALMQALPEDAPKGYLLQPTMSLTMQGLVDQVLEAEGITKDMIDAERYKIELINDLASAETSEAADALMEENMELVDRTFLDLLGAAARSLGQNGKNRQSLRLLNLRGRLMETTEAGQELMAEQEAVAEASRELQALGDKLTREKFVDLLINAADNPVKVSALATLGRVLLDYSTFQLVTNRIDQTQDAAERERLSGLREQLLEIAAAFEEQSRAVVGQAVETLRALIQAPDLRQAILQHIEQIDDTFLAVLQANIEEARRTGNIEASSRLKNIRDEVLKVVEEAAPPEIRLINALLSAETEEQSLEILNEHSGELTPEILDVMSDLADQLRQAGNNEAADRIGVLQEAAARMV